jgi:LmbE family N-acetylglucosaminyl deacetylase
MVRLAEAGHGVHVAILGEGITSRYGSREEAPAELLEKHRQRSRSAGSLLGVASVELFSLPDNRFDTVAMLEVVKIVEDLILRLEPEIVFTQHGGDLNVDHVVTFRAAMTATRPMRDAPVKRLYAYEVPSSTEWSFGHFAPAFRPNVFVDIADGLDRKIAAMQVYESEARQAPHPRAPESLRAIANRWGSVVGLHAAEAFELVRAVDVAPVNL